MTTPPPDELDARRWQFRHRVVFEGKLYGEWTDHHGDARTYSDLPKHVRPGQWWNVTCTEDATRARTSSAEYLASPTAEEVPERWTVADRAARVEIDRLRLVARLAREDTNLDDLTIAQVRATLGGIKAWNQRAAYLAAVLERLGIAG